MSSLTERMLKHKVAKQYVYTEQSIEFISTGCLTLNLLFSGKMTGGIPRGKVSMIAADSAQGKTFIAAKVAANAQKKYDMDVLLIDTEFAFEPSFAEKTGVNIERCAIIQNNQLEEVQNIVMNLIGDMTREERHNVLLVIDSWGNLLTSKAVNDAIEGKDVSDMTAAKKKNSFARMLTGLGCTVFVVNHVISNMSQYEPIVVGGGKGIYFASSSIVMGTSKARSKDGTNINGAIITAKVQKGRFAVEHSRLKFLIKFDGGVSAYYGILDDALEGGFVAKPKVGWYSRPCVDNDKSWREKTIWENDKEFWAPVLENTDFNEYMEKKYSFSHNSIISQDV